MTTDPSRSPTRPAMQPVASIDRAWLRMDEPGNLMQINGVLVLRRPLDPDVLERTLAERLLDVPRFRQRIVRHDGRTVWQDDPHFDIRRHIPHHELPAPGGEAELRALVDALMTQPLDPSRPLWCFHYVANYRDGSALIMRLHHCMGDGLGLLLVLLAMTDCEPSPGERENPFHQLFTRSADIETIRRHAERMMPDGMRLLLASSDAFKDRKRRWLTRLAVPGALLRLTFRPSDPRTPIKGPLVPEKHVAWSRPVPVESVKELGRRLGGTVNDVLVAAMTGAIGRYLDSRGGRAANIRAAMPVSMRPLAELAELGNRFGLMFLSLPVGIVDPVERLRELRRRAGALKRSAEPLAALGILHALGTVPLSVQRLVVRIFGTKATCVFTNVPGPRETLYFAGIPIDDIFFWVPQTGKLGVGISILSYAGNVRLGVVTDAGLVPDPERIVAAFHEELTAMEALAEGGGAAAGPPRRAIAG